MMISVEMIVMGKCQEKGICGISILVLHSAGVTVCFSRSETELSLDTICRSLSSPP